MSCLSFFFFRGGKTEIYVRENYGGMSRVGLDGSVISIKGSEGI
jgi:hypothetical protein